MLWMIIAVLLFLIGIIVSHFLANNKKQPPQTNDNIPTEITKETEHIDNTDDNMANDISHIFVEEAQEIFTELESLLALWQADLDNKTLQTDIRRQFFSLKGGARLTGAKACAEVADSIEQILNTLLENSNIKADPNLFKYVTDGKSIMATLVSDFAQQHTPSVDYKNFILKTKEFVAH